jgi:hypothetical protein
MHAAQRNPYSPEPHLKLAEAAAIRGDTDSERGHLERAKALQSPSASSSR